MSYPKYSGEVEACQLRHMSVHELNVINAAKHYRRAVEDGDDTGWATAQLALFGAVQVLAKAEAPKGRAQSLIVSGGRVRKADMPAPTLAGREKLLKRRADLRMHQRAIASQIAQLSKVLKRIEQIQ